MGCRWLHCQQCPSRASSRRQLLGMNSLAELNPTALCLWAQICWACVGLGWPGRWFVPRKCPGAGGAVPSPEAVRCRHVIARCCAPCSGAFCVMPSLSLPLRPAPSSIPAFSAALSAGRGPSSPAPWASVSSHRDSVPGTQRSCCLLRNCSPKSGQYCDPCVTIAFGCSCVCIAKLCLSPWRPSVPYITVPHWVTSSQPGAEAATWLGNTRGSISRDGPAQSSFLHTVEGDKVPVVHVKSTLGKAIWVFPASGKGRPVCGTVFGQGPGSIW